MATIADDVNSALIILHNKTNKEWISLKEIYNEVEKIRKKPNANKGASIRAALENHSKDSLAIMKEKGSDLYKSIYFNNIELINNMKIGEIFTRDQLMNIFKINGQSGMMKTNSLNALVLTTSSESIYKDSSIENGTIQYTGEGLEGDQTITRNNKTLFYSKENELPVYLFTKDNKKRYIFEGKMELYDKPYQKLENDKNDNERLVWKFPLRIIYSNKDTIYKNIDELSKRISKISNNIMLDENVDITLNNTPLKIRKYRKIDSDRKHNRTKKPDYIAEELFKTRQGEINEEIIFKRELKKVREMTAIEPAEEIERMKNFFENKNDSEGYDILSFELQKDGSLREMYIEVKSTIGNEETPIDITENELEFARNHADQYYLYRIYNSDKNNKILKVVSGKELFNDNNYSFIPTKYKIYSA